VHRLAAAVAKELGQEIREESLQESILVSERRAGSGGWTSRS